MSADITILNLIMQLIPLVKEYLAKGYDQDAIALRLEVSKKQVKELTKQAKEEIELEASLPPEKALALRGLGQLLVELWEAWQQSKSQDTKNPVGDPRFTAQILEVNKERNRILGVGGEDGKEVSVVDLFNQYLEANPSVPSEVEA